MPSWVHSARQLAHILPCWVGHLDSARRPPSDCLDLDLRAFEWAVLEHCLHRAHYPRRSGVIVWAVPGSPLSLIEFPADDAERARRFWAELLSVELEARQAGEGEGWQTHSGAP